MPIRLSGMASGLDTDAIIKSMMDAHRLKGKKVTDKSQILDWKKDRLKEINTKLYKLYAEDLSKLRTPSGFNTKKVTSSNENLVTVKGGNNAPTGKTDITIEQLANNQNLIGNAFDKDKNGKAVTANTKLKDLYIAEGTVFTIETQDGKPPKTLEVGESTTISSFLQTMKSAGINANYDATQKRIFLSSKDGGEENWFTIKSSTHKNFTNKKDIDNAVGYSKLDGANKAKVDAAYKILESADSTKLENALKTPGILENDDDDTKRIKSALADINSLADANLRDIYTKEANDIATTNVSMSIKDAIKNRGWYANVNYADEYKKYEEEAEAALKKEYGDDVDLTDEKYVKEAEALVESYVNSKVIKELDSEIIKVEISKVQKNIEDYGITVKDKNGNDVIIEPIGKSIGDRLNELKNNIKAYYPKAPLSPDANDSLSKLGLTEITRVEVTEGKFEVKAKDDKAEFAASSNSKITYNGLEITGTSNEISVNGLTLTLNGVTNPGEKITLNTTNDIQSTFDEIKKFVTNYNAILKELNSLYYADSAKGYAPLSDDEKEAMTDGQIEKWESKIKDSMLRRDSSIGSVISALKTPLMHSVKASDGKTYSLASFGIGTSSDYSEKGLLHIDGDPDDGAFSKFTNKLMEALESDPDIVSEVLSKTIGNLYKEVDSKMKSIPNVRSIFTFYNDKLITNQQNDYKKKISASEKKLIALENKYYKQYAAMEKAMSTLQSKSNALAGLLGNGGQ